MNGYTVADLQRMGADIVSVGPSVVVPGAKPMGRGRQLANQPRGMNKTEAAYSNLLEAKKQSGEIAGYWYEPLKLRLADRTYYSPDFMVMMMDGVIEFHETKGWMRDDAAVKLKVAAEQFWMFGFVLVKIVKGQWKYERYKEKADASRT